MKWNYSISLSFRPKKWMISSRGHASPGTGSVMWTDAIFCIRLRTQELFISPSFHCWFLISMNVSCTTREHKNPEPEKNLFFYFHKFNFLLLFPCFCQENEERVCRGHKDIHVIIILLLLGYFWQKRKRKQRRQETSDKIPSKSSSLPCL